MRCMHRVVVPVPAATPLFELAVPCEVFGIDRSDLVPAFEDLLRRSRQPT